MSTKAYVLPFLSALLGILAFDFSALFWLGFIFLVPLFLFFAGQKRFWPLVFGVLFFRLVFLAGIVYFAFEPLVWLASLLIFLGLPLSFFWVRRYVGTNAAFMALPFLWTFWDLLEARYTFLPTYVMTAGNIFGASPFLGLAVWGGITGLTFFSAIINALVAAGFYAAKRPWQLSYSALVIIAVFGGWFISRQHLTANAAKYSRQPGSLAIAAVSTNQEFDRAFSDFESDALASKEWQSAQDRIQDALRPVKDELRQKPVDLIILPEDMIDIELWSHADKEAKQKFGIENGGLLIQTYRSLAKEFNANLAPTLTTIQGGRRYNTTLLFSRNGELIGRYNKVRLAIGGETWPFGNWRPFYWNILRRIRPEIGEDSPLFDLRYQYTAGEPALLRADNFSFASLICVEIHYPGDLKGFKANSADFISHTSNNRWAGLGLNKYLKLTDNLRRIEAVWLQMPIIINGRGERPGIITPDGRIEAVPFETGEKNYNVFFGEIRL